MPIAVEFPDGTSREVPSHRKEIKRRSLIGASSSVWAEEPMPDPDWHFEKGLTGMWFAFPRT